MITRVLVIILLLLVNACFVAAEFSLARSRRSRLEAMIRSGDRLARFALRALRDLRRMLSASQLGITLSTLAAGTVLFDLGARIIADLPPFRDTLDVSLLVSVGIVAAILVLVWAYVAFGEVAPRAAAMARPEHVARFLAPGLLVFAHVTGPLLSLIERTAGRAARPLARLARDDEAAHTPEELRLLVEQSEQQGEIEEADAALLEGVFDFTEKSAREVMTPRTEIVGLPADATLDEAMAIVEESLRSRYPVFEETIDDIVGLVLAKDLLRVLHHPPSPFSLRSIMRPVHLIPGSRAVEDVLADFKGMKEHMAIVLDEYGGTAGLVTMEDLLEEIVGEILDEYDEAEPPAPPSRGGEVIVAGSANVSELNERFGLSLPEGDHATVGGFVFATLGRLPAVGDRVTAGGAVFTVHEMDGRRIEALAVDLHAAGDRRAEGR